MREQETFVEDLRVVTEGLHQLVHALLEVLDRHVPQTTHSVDEPTLGLTDTQRSFGHVRGARFQVGLQTVFEDRYVVGLRTRGVSTFGQVFDDRSDCWLVQVVLLRSDLLRGLVFRYRSRSRSWLVAVLGLVLIVLDNYADETEIR